MSYTSYANLYKIGEISFVAGSSVFIDFEISEPSGTDANVTNDVFTWKLSPYGNKDYVSLTKANPTLVNSNTIRFGLTAADTENLSGKYVQELTSVSNEVVYGDFSDIKTEFPLTGSVETELPDTNLSENSILYVISNSILLSENVVIDGLDIDGVPTTETIQLDGTREVLSVNIFSTVSSIDFPAGTVGDTVTIGVKAHVLENVSEVQQGIVTISKKLG